MSTFKEGGVVILHDYSSFRQPAYGRFIRFCVSVTFRIAQSQRPICPIHPAVRDAFLISRLSGVAPGPIATPVEGVHRSVPAPAVPALVVHRPAAARRTLSTGQAPDAAGMIVRACLPVSMRSFVAAVAR